MNIRRIVHHGELWITVTDIASCYELERSELERWVAAELLEPPASVEGVLAWPAPYLDRVAALVRCTRVLRLDVTTVRVLVELGHLQLD